MKEEKFKPAYKLKLKDFIPLKGMWKYNQRCMQELKDSPVEEAVKDNYGIRDSILIAYNIITVITGHEIVRGLTHLLIDKN